MRPLVVGPLVWAQFDWYPVVMYECESWTIKKADCRRTDAFKAWCWRRLLSRLDCKETKPVNPKGNQPWIFIGRTDAEAEASTLRPSVLQFMGVSKSQTQLRNWTKTRIFRGRDIPLIWEVQESLGNWGGIWVVPQNFCRVRVCADERNGSIHDQRGRKQKKEEGKSMRGQTRK